MAKYYVGFFKNRDPYKVFANLIREIEGIDYNHVEIMRRDTDTGETLVYGAVAPISRSQNLTVLEQTHELKKAIEIFPESEEIADFVLKGLMGKPYSTLQILFIYLKIQFKLVANWLPGVKLNLTNELVCTELVGEFLIDACNYDLGMSQEMMTIEDIETVVSKQWGKNVSNAR